MYAHEEELMTLTLDTHVVPRRTGENREVDGRVIYGIIEFVRADSLLQEVGCVTDREGP